MEELELTDNVPGLNTVCLKTKIMDIVNGFDIDTPEGATAYLESEGVDVEAYVKRGMAELKRHKALGLAHVSGSGGFETNN